LSKGPVDGGDTVYLQEQDHSLVWLKMRDEQPIEPRVVAPPPANDDPAAAKALSALVAHSVREKLNARR
jgi:hypothetical protein